MTHKTWPYGTRRRGTVLKASPVAQVILDDQAEHHLLVAGANDPKAKAGDSGNLVFTQGGITGGYWKFTKD